MEKIRCPETYMNNQQHVLCNILEERKPQLYYGGKQTLRHAVLFRMSGGTRNTKVIVFLFVFVVEKKELSKSVQAQTTKLASFFLLSFSLRTGRDSSVGIATRYGLDGPGIESRWGRDFPHPSRPALGPT